MSWSLFKDVSVTATRMCVYGNHLQQLSFGPELPWFLVILGLNLLGDIHRFWQLALKLLKKKRKNYIYIAHGSLVIRQY